MGKMTANFERNSILAWYVKISMPNYSAAAVAFSAVCADYPNAMLTGEGGET
jgi:hypothetical protein